MTEHTGALILAPGDTVAGVFERLERGTTRSGESRFIAILDVDGHERSLWLHEAALLGQFKRAEPARGEVVVVTKGAEKKASETTGRMYWPFTVVVPDRPSEVTWAGIDDEIAF